MAMLEEDDDIDGFEIEASRLCQKLERDGTEIEILIYRFKGTNDPSTLEVVDQEDASTVWDETFATEQAALDEVMRTIEEDGISVFLHPPDDQLH